MGTYGDSSSIKPAPDTADSHESKEKIDAPGVFVSNIDYNARPEELENHFKDCGEINRVTHLFGQVYTTT